MRKNLWKVVGCVILFLVSAPRLSQVAIVALPCHSFSDGSLQGKCGFLSLSFVLSYIPRLACKALSRKVCYAQKYFS